MNSAENPRIEFELEMLRAKAKLEAVTASVFGLGSSFGFTAGLKLLNSGIEEQNISTTGLGAVLITFIGISYGKKFVSMFKEMNRTGAQIEKLEKSRKQPPNRT